MTESGPDIAWVDTIDACHLKCPTCIRGLRGLENSPRRMDIDTFGAIAARLREQGYRRIGLFNWTEPFLNRTIEEYVARAKAAGFWVTLSSTLSLRHIDNLEPALVAGVDLLTVSVSGFDQQTYEINHIGGNLEYVFTNLERVREIIARHRLTTLRVDFRMLEFDYNAHQEPLLREYAERMGFCFERLEATGNPRSDKLDTQTELTFVTAAQAASRPSPEDEGLGCELMFNQIAIDCAGDVYLCCCMPNYPTFRIGRFLEMSTDEILLKRFTHSFCPSCTMPRRDRSESEATRLAAAFRNGRPKMLALSPV